MSCVTRSSNTMEMDDMNFSEQLKQYETFQRAMRRYVDDPEAFEKFLAAREESNTNEFGFPLVGEFLELFCK